MDRIAVPNPKYSTKLLNNKVILKNLIKGRKYGKAKELREDVNVKEKDEKG